MGGREGQTVSTHKSCSKLANNSIHIVPSFLLLWFPLPCMSEMSLKEKRKRTISPFSFFMGTMSSRHQKATPGRGGGNSIPHLSYRYNYIFSGKHSTKCIWIHFERGWCDKWSGNTTDWRPCQFIVCLLKCAETALLLKTMLRTFYNCMFSAHRRGVLLCFLLNLWLFI